MHSHNKKYIDSLQCYFFFKVVYTYIYEYKLTSEQKGIRGRKIKNKNLTNKILIFFISALSQT